jgi:hypothetical protein
MEVKEFLKKVRAQMPEKAWGRLRALAQKGKIKWGRSSCEIGPPDGSGV